MVDIGYSVMSYAAPAYVLFLHLMQDIPQVGQVAGAEAADSTAAMIPGIQAFPDNFGSPAAYQVIIHAGLTAPPASPLCQ